MNALAPAAAARMASIAARLGSPHDGEALNAARLLTRELERAGLRPADVIARGLEPLPQAAPQQPEPSDHQRAAREVLRTARMLSEREIEFLRNMAAAPYCSQAQLEWIDGLLERARRYRASDAAKAAA